ncbi:F0F1 ATP synthase subunit delta [Zavarzinia aquatilis]|uniref:ATP synthase subunit b n=1 Tax=Zavarzinia aquatilis TaxID=2211142 RepID=A0A317EFD0_9PROT|nr:F0F1 ATP synthase subunit delta [Zavarzinia aquatilis]PWR25738.1 ATPase [Zavarzinia aquatilis]
MTVDWWTLGLQAVNVTVLIWLLARFFWRPLAAIVEERRKIVAATLSEAEAKKAEATAEAAKIAETRAGLAAEREAMLAAAREAAEAEGRRLRDDAARDIAAAREAARDQIEKDGIAARGVWAAQAGQLALGIAARLTGRLAPAPLFQSFLTGLAEAARALPPELRAGAIAEESEIAIESASPLDEAAQAACRDALSLALGGTPRLSFRVEPALIAGLEAHGPHFVISNNWRADLARIEAELNHDRAS